MHGSPSIVKNLVMGVFLMVLHLNDPVPEYKAFPEEGTGRMIDLMPLLRADRRVMLTMEHMMLRYLGLRVASQEVQANWRNHRINTCDLCVQDPHGSVKIAVDSPALYALTPEAELYNGGLVLDYPAINGEEFTRAQVEKYTGRDQSKHQAKTNPFWRAFARDPHLHKEFVDAVFAVGKVPWSYKTMMGVYVPDVEKITVGRPWAFDKFKSRAIAQTSLDDPNGLLIGYTLKMFIPDAEHAPSLEEHLER
jgi:hypothetical protein